MKKEELLLAQIRMYITLAKSLRSNYYLERAKATIALYNIHKMERTFIIEAA